MSIHYINPKEPSGKRVLVRLDLNEGVSDAGILLDDFRIRASLPTVQMLLAAGNRVTVCAHLGRPDGKVDPKFSLRPVAVRLAELLDLKFIETRGTIPSYPTPHLVFHTGDIADVSVRSQIALAKTDDLVLLENIRFYPEEESDPAAFAEVLKELGDVYVNDAFSVSHHASGSVTEVAKLLPSYGGPLLRAEVENLSAVFRHPKSPFTVVMGGAKISDKVECIHNLADRSDAILIGGALANLFFLARGYEVGISKVEAAGRDAAFSLLKTYGKLLVLPEDVVVADKNFTPTSIRTCEPHEVASTEQILDIGPRTILAWASVLKKSKTIVWNGPLGYIEKPPFHTGSSALCKVMGGLGKRTAFVVAGGGETVDVIREAGQMDHFDHVSTGGGAMLELLAGKELPGVTVLGK